jgi:hypothetical protein
MTLSKVYPTLSFSSTPSLDRLLSATFFFTTKWSERLQSNRARDLLRYVVCRLYDQERGNLMNPRRALIPFSSLGNRTVAKGGRR